LAWSARGPSAVVPGRMIAGMSAADPGLFALKGALRAAIVVPVAFALALVVFDQPQMALFASFGSMALLVFVDFAGSWRARLRAYLLFVLSGACLIALGTVCSHSVWLATVAMAVVAFAILFAGVLNGYIAAAHSGAMLTFVLPVMVPAGVGVLGMRLAGWGLAGALSISATLLLWPQRPRDALRADAARAARALAALIQAQIDADPADPVTRARVGEDAREATVAVRRRFLGMQHRPGGTASRVAALARLTEDLGWLHGLAGHGLVRTDAHSPLRHERMEIEAAVPGALRAIAARLDLGEEGRAGVVTAEARRALERVRSAHEALGHALVKHAAHWQSQRDEALATRELDEAYRLRQLTAATLRTGRDALLACGDPVSDDPLGTRRARIDATGRLARAHTSMRSVWLRNSVRAAAGLALAVLIGQLSDLQHAFWIVLGTMSVLRSSALATGSTIVQALLGMLGGIVVGGVLVALAGDDRAVLWTVLPFAVLLAGYAPRAISFAAGQGAFSLVVLVLFNLLAPAGWRVGIVRVEDVAIGAGVSLLAGVLIWPRGATAVVREAVGATYVRAAGYLDVTIEALLGPHGDDRSAGGGGDGDGGGGMVDADAGHGEHDGRASPGPAAREAVEAAQLLEATVRDYLAERSSARGSLDDLTMLTAGAARVRRVAGLLQNAQEFARLAPVDGDLPRLALARAAFERERRELCDWYAKLGVAISQVSPAPVPQAIDAQDPDEPPAAVVLERGADAREGIPQGLAIAWAHRNLAALAEHEPALVRAADSMLPS